MSPPEIKGYCPGALRPMMSGDGLVVRVRPFGGRLSAAQATGIAQQAVRHGNGTLDLSSRANMQIRGVTEASYPALIDGLRALGVLDTDTTTESRRNILVTPFWRDGDATDTIVGALTKALADPSAPELPHKFGFAVDTGPTPVLQHASADIRLERGAGGALLLRADGADVAKPVTDQDAVAEAIDLAHWFCAQTQKESRMRALVRRVKNLPQDHFVSPQSQTYVPRAGITAQGCMVGFAFGQMTADMLGRLADLGPLRLTPWRIILIDGHDVLPNIDGVITTPDNPLLRITACIGGPACAQALGDTRTTARAVAPHLPPQQTLHISGCAKGCAHPMPAPLTLIASRDGFDLVKQGRAGDTPAATALSTDDIIKAL